MPVSIGLLLLDEVVVVYQSRRGGASPQRFLVSLQQAINPVRSSPCARPAEGRAEVPAKLRISAAAGSLARGHDRDPSPSDQKSRAVCRSARRTSPATS